MKNDTVFPVNFLLEADGKPLKRFTFDAIGKPLAIYAPNSRGYSEVEFDDCIVCVPEEVAYSLANTIKPEDTVHMHYHPGHETTNIKVLQDIVKHLKEISKYLFDDEVTAGYRLLLMGIQLIHDGYWVVEYI